MRILTWLFYPLLVLATPLLVGWWAWGVAPLFGVVAALFGLTGAMILLHNFDGPLGRAAAASDDQFLFHTCESGVVTPFRRLYRRLPASPRCRVCLVPFGGIGRWLGIRPSRKNANFCQSCLEAAPMGGHEKRIGVLFADIRGFTTHSETHGPTAAAALLERFYSLANDVLTQDDALVELVGDQVMALYVPMFPSLADHKAQVMVAAARRLIATANEQTEPIPIGVGLHIGTGSVGNVRKGAEKDFTAVGDVVNTAARLQARAGDGEIMVSAPIHAEAAALVADAEPLSLELKGKAEPFLAYKLSASPGHGG